MDQLAAGVHQLRIQRFVNVYLVDAGEPGTWVLVDAGLPGAAATIRAAAAERYGADAKPEAILLTHGHLDHVGAALELAQGWGVPVIAHPLEIPYLTKKAYYPPADPTVGGSLGFVCRFFPRELPNLTDVLEPLPLDLDDAPYLPGWRWLHVPGHAPGQIALWREADHTLIGGDAFATCNHESVPATILGKPRISVAGAPFNYDWQQCRDSVQKLAALEPRAIGCGHGPVMTGVEALGQLKQLAGDYPVPTHGRYHLDAARADASGVEHLPPPAPDPLPKVAAAVGIAALLGGTAWLLVGGRRKLHRPKEATPPPARSGGRHDYPRGSRPTRSV